MTNLGGPHFRNGPGPEATQTRPQGVVCPFSAQTSHGRLGTRGSVGGGGAERGVDRGRDRR